MFKKETLEKKYKEIDHNIMYTLDKIVLLTGLSTKTLRRHIKDRLLSAVIEKGQYQIVSRWLQIYMYNLIHDTYFQPYKLIREPGKKSYFIQNPDLPLELQLPDDEAGEENDE